MAKFKEKIKAQELRRQGKSINEITKRIKVSKSTVSIWCRGIELNPEQIAKLDENESKGKYKGRIKGATIQKKRYLEKVKQLKKEARKEISRFKKRDLFIAGIGLYWGEGSKTGSRIGFHNSDPMVIQFMMKWFRDIFKIPEKEFTMHVCINEIHKYRLDKVNKYWSKITKIPLKQFRKPILAKVKNKKIYTNFHEHFGTLTIRVNKSSILLHKIRGYIEALSKKAN